MKNRTLGNGQAVSSIGLGCMGMDHAYGKPAPRKDMVKLLRHAVDLGCTFFDTAVVYGEANEELLGEAFSSVRDQVVLATKFGIAGQRIEDGKTVNLLDSKPASIRVQAEGSLRRLRTDHIDLYYQHRVDPHVEPELVAETMHDLIREGKILGWGLSNAPVDYMKRAHAVCPLAAVENQYSMMWREPEQGLFDLYPEEKKRWYVKVPVFSFNKIRGLDAYLSPEMKSTGEAIGYDDKLNRALFKALQASGMKLQNYGTVFATIADKDKKEALPLIRRFYDLGFNIEATEGTARFLKDNGIRTRILRKISEGSEEIRSSISQGHIAYVINTSDIGSAGSMNDGYEIRKYATENNVNIFTALDTVKVLLDVLEETTLKISTIDA